MLSYGKRVRENRVFKTDRRKKNLLILGLEDREVNTIDRELCEMKWKIFFISILAFFFYEIKFRYSIFEYTNTRLLLFNFDSFFFFSLPLKNRTEFENAIFTPRSLFIFVRGILRIPIQFREFFYIWQVFKLDFHENEFSREKMLFLLFNLSLHVESHSILIAPARTTGNYF